MNWINASSLSECVGPLQSKRGDSYIQFIRYSIEQVKSSWKIWIDKGQTMLSSVKIHKTLITNVIQCRSIVWDTLCHKTFRFLVFNGSCQALWRGCYFVSIIGLAITSNIWNLITCCLMWIVWLEQNHRSFEGTEKTLEQLKVLCQRSLFDWSRCWGFTDCSSFWVYVFS